MISNAASSKLEPPINVTTENTICNYKLVVILDVPRGENKPYAAKKTDYWVKVAADKRRATREELRRLIQASGTVYADEMPIPSSSIDDIDMFFFKEFYEREYGLALEESHLSFETLLSNLKLIKGDNLTLSGLLLFGKNPERLKPKFSVRTVAFCGTDISSKQYLDSENIEGKLLNQYENTMGFS